MTTLTKLQLEQIERIQVVLNNMGCAYVIRQPDGTTYGSLEAFVQKPAKRKTFKFPRGTLLNYYEGFIKDLKAGESALVPLDKFASYSLQGAIGSYCMRNWGEKSFITTFRRDENAIEVLRTGGI